MTCNLPNICKFISHKICQKSPIKISFQFLCLSRWNRRKFNVRSIRWEDWYKRYLYFLEKFFRCLNKSKWFILNIYWLRHKNCPEEYNKTFTYDLVSFLLSLQAEQSCWNQNVIVVTTIKYDWPLILFLSFSLSFSLSLFSISLFSVCLSVYLSI